MPYSVSWRARGDQLTDVIIRLTLIAFDIHGDWRACWHFIKRKERKAKKFHRSKVENYFQWLTGYSSLLGYPALSLKSFFLLSTKCTTNKATRRWGRRKIDTFTTSPPFFLLLLRCCLGWFCLLKLSGAVLCFLFLFSFNFTFVALFSAKLNGHST